MVTSAVGSEGKTSLAVLLAFSPARAWQRTLLIDANLCRPAIHRVFGLPAEPGFAEVLRGEGVLEQVIQSTPVSRLWVLPAGRLDDHAPYRRRYSSRMAFVVSPDSHPLLR